MRSELSELKRRGVWSETFIKTFRTRHVWIGGFGLMLLFVSLRWNNYNAPLGRDEGEYAYSAQILLHGAAPYQYAFMQKPPMVIYSYLVSGLFAPDIFWAPRVMAGVFVMIATILLGGIARLEFGKGVAWPTMYLVTPMLLLPELDQFIPNTEMFMLLPLILTLGAYSLSRNQSYKTSFIFLAGFLGGITFFYKYTALPLLFFIYLFWLIEIWRLKTPGLFWRSAVLLVLGAILAGALALGYFLLQDGGAALWECTVQFNRHYAGSHLFGWTALWVHLESFLLDWWILFLLPCAVFSKPSPRIWFWITLFAAAWVGTGKSSYGQYYILLMPFWAVLSAVGIRNIVLRLNESSLQPSRWFAGLITTVVMLLLLRPDVPWLICSPAKFVGAKFISYPFSEARIAARRVAELSSKDDFVYIAGSEPEILCYAGRFSPTRFITVYGLMTPTPRIRDYQQTVIQDLLKRPPALIVYVNSPASWTRQEATPLEFFAFLNKFMAENYERIGGYVIEGGKGRWVEPLMDQEQADASLVLFKRKGIERSP